MFKLFRRKKKIKELEGYTFVDSDITNSEIDEFLNIYFTKVEKDKENKINEINETVVCPIEIKASIGDLKVIKFNSNDLKANEISKEKLNLNMDIGDFSVLINWISYSENKVSSIINKDGYIKMSVIKENLK